MEKQKELTYPGSCWNKAKDKELVFILLERDPAAAHAVRAWIDKRIELGKNTLEDAQIYEAMNWADTVQLYHDTDKPNRR